MNVAVWFCSVEDGLIASAQKQASYLPVWYQSKEEVFNLVLRKVTNC